jgi:hypothetical protein
MKLGQKAMSVLEKWGAFKDDRRNLIVESGKHEIVGEVTAADNMSCSLAHLRLNVRDMQPLQVDELQAWGDRVAKRVRYLLEAIDSVELDAPHGRLLLRSTPPEKKPDGTVFYYELLFEATGKLTVERRRFNPNDRSRTAERLHCTHELLEKLIDDLVATAPQS